MIKNFLRDDYDVVVVGAGPAGSTTAKKCAKNGLNTLLIEKRQEIGAPKRCAEGISTNAADELGLDIPSYCIANTINGAIVYAPNGKRFVVSFGKKTEGVILERKSFDKWLAQQASDAGAKVISKTEFIDFIRKDGKITGVVVDVSGERKEINAKVIVAADGVESTVMRKARLNTTKKLQYVDSGYQYEMSNIDIEDERKIILYFGNKIAPRGYVWVFPKGNGRANVGIGVNGNSEKKAKDYLDDFIAKTPTLLKGSILEVNAGNVPVGDLMKNMVIENVLGVGDAVNQVNPIHGGGIAESIKAAAIAADAIKRALDKNDTKLLREYNVEWWDKRGNSLKNVERVREIFEKLSDDNLNDLAESITSSDLMDFAKGTNLPKLIKVTAKFSVKTLKRKIGLK